MTEKQYIRYRKLKASLNSLCFYMCRLFPVKRNLVSVCTFEGKGGFGCNPKYLVQEMHEQNPDYEFVWFVNDMSKEFPDYIKKVPNTLWSRAYWLTRSKVWIDNYRKPYGTVKRKGQYYLNVNHYTIGIKCTGLWRGSGFSKMAYLVSKNDSDMIDGLVIDSKWCEDVSPKGLVYDGDYVKTGAPRCDILFGNRLEIKKAFRTKHDLPENAKIVMYAPTFREGAKDGKRFVFSEVWTIDFERLLDSLTKKFGGDWYLCVRVHPQLAPTFEDYHNPALEGRIINESQADDMYEILAAMDAYITDYSSACFEAGFTWMPVFLYADDVQKYANDRGQLMWNLVEDDRHAIGNNKDITPAFDLKMPFPLSHNNDELEEDILAFDETSYSKNLDEMYNQMGLVFNGDASKKIASMLLKLD
ncbi:MAG: CDP-glycerol glycerophosphotransferase family protein [Pseudobutyrivibrio sp.]|nr:CDP-glycerol glycerophosphotransferase family protein [Pseudobutyrivibrio sp.]